MDRTIIIAGWLTFLSVVFFAMNVIISKEGITTAALQSNMRNVNTKSIIINLSNKLGYDISAWYPAATIEDLYNKLMWAGFPYGLTPQSFLGIKILIAGAILILSFGLSLANVPFIFGIILAVMGFMAPDFWLSAVIERRRKKIRKELPLMLDFLIIALKAGVELGPALEKVSEQLTGPLGEELRLTWRDIAVGKSRAVAFRNMAERIGLDEINKFVQTIIIAEERGVSNLADTLTIFNTELNETRKRKAEEEARKVPTKILLPLIVCIFLPMVALLLMPVIQMISEMGLF
ncbi:MAG: type II secretion system F family protein [Thermovenabulum sp.]|uniref:type II secretion system F family protein n=1 Tax=Thermovenabulum sp. TaxID=3100335 RepID=UPI003C7A53DF